MNNATVISFKFETEQLAFLNNCICYYDDEFYNVKYMCNLSDDEFKRITNFISCMENNIKYLEINDKNVDIEMLINRLGNHIFRYAHTDTPKEHKDTEYMLLKDYLLLHIKAYGDNELVKQILKKSEELNSNLYYR